MRGLRFGQPVESLRPVDRIGHDVIPTDDCRGWKNRRPIGRHQVGVGLEGKCLVVIGCPEQPDGAC